MQTTPYVHVEHDPADDLLPGRVVARSAEGLAKAEIRVQWGPDGRPEDALRLLARAALEVIVAARASRPVECEASR